MILIIYPRKYIVDKKMMILTMIGDDGDNDNSDDNYLAKMSDKKNQDDPGGCHRPYSIIH